MMNRYATYSKGGVASSFLFNAGNSYEQAYPNLSKLKPLEKRKAFDKYEKEIAQMIADKVSLNDIGELFRVSGEVIKKYHKGFQPKAHQKFDHHIPTVKKLLIDKYSIQQIADAIGVSFYQAAKLRTQILNEQKEPAIETAN